MLLGEFGRPATSGKVHHRSTFLYLEIMALTVAQVSPKALEEGGNPFHLHPELLNVAKYAAC